MGYKVSRRKNTLTKLGEKGLTAYEVRGRGDQIGMIRTRDSGANYEVDNLVPKRKMEIVCIEEEVNKIVHSIASNASTWKPGYGKIFVSDIDDVIHIRTVQQGQDAV